MRKVRRIFKRTLWTVFIIISALVLMIIFPQLLFANKMKYKNFTVCSNDQISEDLKTVLDNATILVEKSELYDSNYRFNIILCHNTFYNKIDDLLGVGPAARARLHNAIIKVRIDPKKNLAFATFPNACELDLTYLIAHEMIHCLQGKKYGVLKFNPLRHPAFWKLEGYPEYVAKKTQLSDKDYSLTGEIERYVKSTNKWSLPAKDGCEFPDYYFKGRLMIEYLMDVKHWSYDQILKDTISEGRRQFE